MNDHFCDRDHFPCMVCDEREASAASTPLETTADAKEPSRIQQFLNSVRTYTKIEYFEGEQKFGFIIPFGETGFGFGEMAFIVDKATGEATFDNEEMRMDTCLTLLRRVVGATVTIPRNDSAEAEGEAPSSPPPPPPPPTSEPSEEEVQAMTDAAHELEAIYRFEYNDGKGGIHPAYVRKFERDMSLVNDLRRLAARRASRVEPPHENAGASVAAEPRRNPTDAEIIEGLELARQTMFWLSTFGIARLNKEGLDPAFESRLDADLERVCVLLTELRAQHAPQSVDAAASHREPSEPDVNATRLRTLYDALPWQQQMRFGGDFAEFCEGLDAAKVRGPSEPVTDAELDTLFAAGGYIVGSANDNGGTQRGRRVLDIARRLSSSPRPTEEGV